MSKGRSKKAESLLVAGMLGAAAALVSRSGPAPATPPAPAPPPPPMLGVSKPRRSKKLLLSVSALCVAAAMAGLGTFATFTSTTTASQVDTAGKVVITLGGTNRLTVAATNLVPGDTVSRMVDLLSTSTDPLKTVGLVTTATTSSVLDTDLTTGLKMHIQTCSLVTGWVEAGSAPAYTYTCPLGTIVDVLATTASPVTVVQTGTLTPLNALTTATSSTDHLLVVVSLPQANTAANLATPPTSTILFTFTGTQRDGTAR